MKVHYGIIYSYWSSGVSFYNPRVSPWSCGCLRLPVEVVEAHFGAMEAHPGVTKSIEAHNKERDLRLEKLSVDGYNSLEKHMDHQRATFDGISGSYEGLWRTCNLTAFIHSLTGPVCQPFASRYERPGFNPQGGTYVKPGFSR
jgi:hypothetical protein